MYKEGNLWKCTECHYQYSQRGHVYKHVEAKHIVHGGYSCQICGRVLKTKESLRVHTYHSHPKLN